jgi:CheY-like chemotaxis protein
MSSPQLKKILYAEDEPDIRQIATIAFEAIGGFTVETCESGETVVETAHAFKPDLVVLDVMMPGVDGPGAMGALRQTEEFQHTPVVFMTAKVMPAELDRFKQLGVLDVITKPFDPTTLCDQINRIWDDHHAAD